MDANDMKRAEDFLAHYGVKGMKWGVINEDDLKKIRIGASDKWKDIKSKISNNTPGSGGRGNSESLKGVHGGGGRKDGSGPHGGGGRKDPVPPVSGNDNNRKKNLPSLNTREALDEDTKLPNTQDVNEELDPEEAAKIIKLIENATKKQAQKIINEELDPEEAAKINKQIEDATKKQAQKNIDALRSSKDQAESMKTANDRKDAVDLQAEDAEDKAKEEKAVEIAEQKRAEAAEKQKKMDDILASKKQKQEDRQAAEDAKKKAQNDALNRDRNEFESQVKNMSPDVQKEYNYMSPAERDIFVKQYGANAANMLDRRISERDAARNSASGSNSSDKIGSSDSYNLGRDSKAKEAIKNMLRDQRDTESAYKVWDSISDERKDKYIKKYGMEKGIQKLLSGDLDISDSLSDLLDKIKNKETKAQKKGEKKASNARKKFNNWVLKQDAFDDDPIVGDAMTVDILDEYMAHWGILGQKWGFRRYQNPDGTLTEEGKKRYSSKSMRESTYRNRRNLTDEDLENLTKRLEAEKKFRSLNDEDTHKGRDFMTDMMKRVGVIAIPAIGLAAAGAAVVAGSKTGQEHLRTKDLEGFIGKKDRFVYDGPSGSGNLTGGQFFGRQYLDSVAGMFDRFFKMDKKK